MTRKRMRREDRAKQFMPFAALKGYEEALRKKEKTIVPRVELSEDYKELLDWELQQVHIKDMITVIYYDGSSYLKKTGMVSKIDKDRRCIKIVDVEIPFASIYDLKRG